MSKQHLSQKTNTARINTLLTDPVAVQIAEAITHEELSSREISNMIHEDKQEVRKDIALLMRAHVIKRHLHRHHQPTYVFARPKLEQTVHILYQLWADAIASRSSHSIVAL